VNARDEYRHKASECLELAGRTGSEGTMFLAMAMLWVRLAEEIDRVYRFDTTSRNPT